MAEESLCLHLLDEFLGVPPDKRADIEARYVVRCMLRIKEIL